MRDAWIRGVGEWYRQVGNDISFALAYIRINNDRYEVAAEVYGKKAVWHDYCDAKGGSAEQEYKAKRKATSMAKKLLK